MPLLPGARTPLELIVADRVVADTVIRQKARRTGFECQFWDTGECVARIVTTVTMYAADATAPDGLGPALTAAGFAPREVVLHADNQTVVDAATGALLCTRRGEAEADWQAKVDGYAQPTMLQGDFFAFLCEHVPVKINDMVRLHMQQADAMGRFA